MARIDILLVFVHITGIVAESKFAKYLKTEYNDLRFSPSLRLLWNSSLTKCLTTCELTGSCVALSFHASRMCALSQYRPFNILASTITERDWIIYMKHSESCWPYGYNGIVQGGMCYFWQEGVSGASSVSWTAGQDNCRVHGANLVCTDTLEEQNSLKAAIPLYRWWSGFIFDGSDLSCNGKPAKYNTFKTRPRSNNMCVFWQTYSTSFVRGNCENHHYFVCQKTWY